MEQIDNTQNLDATEASTKTKTKTKVVEQEGFVIPSDLTLNSPSAKVAIDDYVWNEQKHVKISCLDPNKRAYPGEVFCVGNAKHYLRRWVSFDKPYMVERMILDVIADKTYIRYKQEQRNGETFDIPEEAKAYSIEYLAPLTERELEVIKKKQQLRDE